MPLMMASVAVAILASALDVAPRVVVSLSRVADGKAAVKFENASPRAVALSATTYLVLLTPDTPDGMPSYWARIEGPTVPTTSGPLKLGGLETSTVHVDVRSLLWSRDRTGLSPDQPIGRIVPAGTYALQVQVVDAEERWWRSGELPATVSPTGILRF